MPKAKICAVQCNVTDNFLKNASKVENFFRKAGRAKCSLICFPEIFFTGPVNKKTYAREIPVECKKIFSYLSKKYRVYSVMGSMIEKIGKNHYNISYLFDDKGKILGSYRKHRLVAGSEGKFVTPGNKFPVFKTRFGKIGIQICYDLLYPEVTRKLMMNGAEIIICPSFWAAKSSNYDYIYNNKYFRNRTPDEVTSLVSARAIESEVIFVFVNAAGTYNYGARSTLLGKTQIGLPFFGTTQVINSNKETLLIKEIDLGIVKDAKKVYKVERNLRGYYKR